MKRRKLIKNLAICSGAATAGLFAWQLRPITPAHFPEENLTPPGTTRPRLLVVYGSMHGTTGGIARLIAEKFRGYGFATRVALAESWPDPNAFDAVVLGSAVRGSAWLPDAIAYAARFARTLSRKPILLFQCSMTCAGFRISGSPLSLNQRLTLRESMASLLHAVPFLRSAPHDFLSGALDFDLLSPGLRIGYPVMSGSLLSGDFRSASEVDAMVSRTMKRGNFQLANKDPSFLDLL